MDKSTFVKDGLNGSRFLSEKHVSDFILLFQLRSSLNKEGFIFISSDRTRHQHMNIADALEKLRELIRSCEPVQVAQPTPETVELHRKRAEKAARERLRQKRDRSSTKSSRGAADF